MKAKKLEKLIYRSFDAELSEKEKTLLETELQQSADLKAEFEYLKGMRKAVKSSVQTSFSPFFEERLMNKLNNPVKTESYLDPISKPLFASFGRIAVVAIILLIILISYNLNNGNSYAIENLLGSSKTTVASAFDPFQNTLGVNQQ